jgi:hypothetical protein
VLGFLKHFWDVPHRLGLIQQALGNQYIQAASSSPTLLDPKRLERFGFKGYSQYDEDGILKEIFRRVGVTNRRFVEFGVGDGLENNSVYLLCQGWSGAWIDSDRRSHESQCKHFAWAIREGRLSSVHQHLTPSNINRVIGENAKSKGPIDLLSVDVDGNDYYLFEALEVVEPRVCVLEYNGYVPPPVLWVMDYAEQHAYDGSGYFGASLKSLELLAKTKGYTLVGCNLVGLNAFFVKSELANDKFAGNGMAEELFQPRRYWLDRAYATGSVPYRRPFVAK